MILELSKSDYKWFAMFLENYQYMMRTHMLNGTRIDDDIKDKMLEITSMEREKSGMYIIPLEYNQVEFFIEILEENMCCCPGCNITSVRHRKNIANKLYRMINPEEFK